MTWLKKQGNWQALTVFPNAWCAGHCKNLPVTVRRHCATMYNYHLNELTTTAWAPLAISHTYSDRYLYTQSRQCIVLNKELKPAWVGVEWLVYYSTSSTHATTCSLLCTWHDVSSLHFTWPPLHLANTTQTALESHAVFIWRPSSNLTLA